MNLDLVKDLIYLILSWLLILSCLTLIALLFEFLACLGG